MKIIVYYHNDEHVSSSTFREVREYTTSLNKNFIKITDKDGDVHIVNLRFVRTLSVIKNED